MNILFIGNFDVSYSTETHHLKTFQKMGHKVYKIQENRTSIEEIIAKLDNIDLLFHTHTHGFNIVGLDKIYNICKENNIPSVGYHLDLWLGIERQKDLRTDPYWKIEYFFTVDKKMADLMNSRDGMPKAFYLPAGVFEDECYIGTPQSRYKHDVIFVGSKNYHPEWGYRKELIDFLEKNYGKRFGLYGGEHTVRGEQLNNLYASAKVVVGDTLCKGFNYPHYFSDRVFETTGRGGFIIHPQIKGLSMMFEQPKEVREVDRHPYLSTDKAEIVTYPFGNFDYLSYLIDYYIKNDEEREAIQMRGHERTKKDHTYTNRLSYILATIKNEKTNNEN